MSAAALSNPFENNYSKLRKIIKRLVPNDEEYLASTIDAIRQSREIIKNKSDWVTVLGNRVFTKKINLENTYNILGIIEKLKVPVLILHGRKDSINLIEEAEKLGNILAEAGNNNFTTIYFGELDHFFGTVVKEPPIKDHIEVDIEVVKSIVTWLNKNMPRAAPVESVESSVESTSITETTKVNRPLRIVE
jgi:hypothetical protein